MTAYEAAAIDATTVKVAKTKAGSVLAAGQFIMAAPTSLTGTGTGLAIVSVDTSNPAYDELTLSAALAAAITKDSVLVEADKAGTGAKMKVVPNALTSFDIYVDPTSTQFSCSAVVEATVYERRIPPVIKAIKDSFYGEITFSQSK